MTTEQKALLVAIELMTKAVVALPMQIAQNAGKTAEELQEKQHAAEKSKFDTLAFGRDDAPNRFAYDPRVGGKDARDMRGDAGGPKAAQGDAEKKKEKADVGAIGSLFSALTARFAAAIGPLAVLGAVVASNVSGFNVLWKSVQLFAATLAPIILPVAVLLATAFTAVADVLTATLQPGMESFFEIILSLGIPALIVFIDALRDVADFIKRNFKGEGGFTGGFGDSLTSMLKAILPAGLADEEGSAIAPQDRPDTEKIVMSALRDVATSLRMSIGPRAQISGLEGIGKSAQLAALNQDPIEARALRVQQQIAAMLERVVRKMESERRDVYGPGGFLGGST